MRNPKTNPFSLFFDAVMKNHIGLIATLIVITSCVLWIMGEEVPELLGQLLLIVISFLFGSKVGQSSDEK